MVELQVANTNQVDNTRMNNRRRPQQPPTLPVKDFLDSANTNEVDNSDARSSNDHNNDDADDGWMEDDEEYETDHTTTRTTHIVQ
jgi:hypothetical protein